MKKIGLMLVAVLMLSACGSKEKVTVCKGTTEGIEVVNTITYAGKEVSSIVYENSMVVDESLIDYITDYLDQYKTTIADIKGLSYDYKVNGTTVTETVTINYDEADMTQLVSEGFVDAGDKDTVDYVGYEQTVQNMKELGLTCTEQ